MRNSTHISHQPTRGETQNTLSTCPPVLSWSLKTMMVYEDHMNYFILSTFKDFLLNNEL